MTVVGVGVDMEPIDSFRDRSLSSNRAFYRRIFSQGEITYCQKFKDPSPHFAARFCAKEAMVKAARSLAAIHVTDVQVENNADGAPHLLPRGECKDVLEVLKKHRAHLSISHTDAMAVAFVVLEKKGRA